MAVINGTSGRNILRGTNFDDLIRGFGGNDVLIGRSGNDRIIGGNGNDRLSGGAGNDRLFGGNGNDVLNGNSGDDFIRGGGGVNTLRGGAGNDTLDPGRGEAYGGAGNDRLTGDVFTYLYGGGGNDTITLNGRAGGRPTGAAYGGAGDDVLNVVGVYADGGSGNDVIRATLGKDGAILGGAGNDRIIGTAPDGIFGGTGDDTIIGATTRGPIDGGAGNDVITSNGGLITRGGTGNDILRTGNGVNARFEGGAGADTLIGRAGTTDTATYENSGAGVRVDLTTGTGSGGEAEGDRLTEIENIFGSRFDDVLIGDDDDNVLTGYLGNNDVYGGGGDDLVLSSGGGTLQGGAGDDVVLGGSGDSRMIYSFLDNIGATDTYNGGAGTDTLELIVDNAIWAQVQGDVAALQAHVASGNSGPFTISRGIGPGITLTTLAVQDIENVVVTFVGAPNTPPDVTPHVRNVGEDGPALGVNLLGGATDPDPGQALSVAGIPASVTTSGGRILQQGTDFTVTGAIFAMTTAGFQKFNNLSSGASDTITLSFNVSDGIASVPNTLTVNVAGANDAAAITGDIAGQVSEDGLLVANGTLQVTDVDVGQAQAIPAVDTGTYGTFTVQAGGQWNYALDNGNPAVQALNDGETLSENFQVTSADGSATETVTITILGQDEAPVNTPPVSVDDSYASLEDRAITVAAAAGVLGNDSDADGDPITAALAVDVQNGTLVLNADGGFTYTPDAGFSGTDTFTYVADDGTDQSAASTVTIDVAPLLPDVTFTGTAANEEFGYSVSSAGDVDNDGLDDILIGARRGDIPGADNVGETYLVWGSAIQAAAGGSVDLSSLSATGSGIVLQGINFTDESGFSVSDAGDVNNDGHDDILIGAPNADPVGNPQGGETYLLWGSALSSDADGFVDLATITGDGSGVRFDGQNAMGGADASGWSVSSAGDVDGDGLADVLIGAPFADRDQAGNFDTGRTYVIWGSTITNDADGIIDLGAVGAAGVGVQLNGIDATDRSGFSVSSAGDVDNDGLDDILIGVPLGDLAGAGTQNEGETYLIWGASLEGDADGQIDLAAVVADDSGVRIDGIVENGANSGHAVSNVGDLDGDGFDEILVSSPIVNQAAGLNAGETYLIWGSALAGDADNIIDLETLVTDGAGIEIRGAGANDLSGISVSGAGDVDNDGINDILVGANQASPSALGDTGAAYLLWGSRLATHPTGVVELATIDDTGAGVTIEGEQAGEDAGFSVSMAGDVNGDGFDDLLVGAPGADPGGLTDAGRAYLISGATLLPPPPNIPAEIGGTTTGQVFENGVTTFTGQLSVTDANPGEDSFQAGSGLAGSFGAVTIDATGEWTYTLDAGSPALQTLDTGQFLTDTVTVRSLDGTEQALSIRIAGDGGGGGGGGTPSDFLGKQLEYQYLFTTIDTNWPSGVSLPLDAQEIFTVGSGVEYRDFNFLGALEWSIDVSASTIEVSFARAIDWTVGYPFNGFRITDIADNVRDISGVNVSVQGALNGDLTSASFDANNIWVEWGGQSFAAGATVTIDVTFAQSGNDPIVLDLDSDGFTFRDQVTFDLDDDGNAESIGWVGAGDGLLVVDLDGSGSIESGREVISERFDGVVWDSSMDALRALDRNVDGVFDASDPAFADVFIWRDDGDAISEAGELAPLDAFSITSIHLDTTPQDYEIDGQRILATGTAQVAGGDTLDFVAVAFAATPSSLQETDELI